MSTGNVFVEYALVVVLFFVISATYSSAGLGGFSSYAITLTVFSIEEIEIVPTILICSLIVSGMSVIFFFQNGHVKFRKTWPLIASAMAGYFLGNLITFHNLFIDVVITGVYLVLGVLLFLDSYRKTKLKPLSTAEAFLPNLVIGGVAGVLSGYVGELGGLFVLPALFLLKWDRTKYVTAAASLVTLAISLLLLAKYFVAFKFSLEIGFIAPLAIAVLFGSLIGTHMNIKIFTGRIIKRTATALIFLFAARIMYQHFVATS